MFTDVGGMSPNFELGRTLPDEVTAKLARHVLTGAFSCCSATSVQMSQKCERGS
jgi:hypothetical protein